MGQIHHDIMGCANPAATINTRSRPLWQDQTERRCHSDEDGEEEGTIVSQEKKQKLSMAMQ